MQNGTRALTVEALLEEDGGGGDRGEGREREHEEEQPEVRRPRRRHGLFLERES